MPALKFGAVKALCSAVEMVYAWGQPDSLKMQIRKPRKLLLPKNITHRKRSSIPC